MSHYYNSPPTNSQPQQSQPPQYTPITQWTESTKLPLPFFNPYSTFHPPLPYLYPALNNTILLFYRYLINRLYHHQIENGALIREIVLKGFRIERIVMFSERVVGVWGYDFGRTGYYVVEVDLGDEGRIRGEVKVDVEEGFGVDLLVFSQTKMIAIVMRRMAQNTENDQGQIKIAYYNFPFCQPSPKPTHLHTVPNPTPIYSYTQPLNTHSSILWRQLHNPQQLPFSIIHIFDLKSQKIREYKLKHFFIQEKGMPGLYYAEIGDIWEIGEIGQGRVYVEMREVFSLGRLEVGGRMRGWEELWLKEPIVKEKWRRYVWDLKQEQCIDYNFLKDLTQNSISYQVQFLTGLRNTPQSTPSTPLNPTNYLNLHYNPRTLIYTDLQTDQPLPSSSLPQPTVPLPKTYPLQNLNQYQHYCVDYDPFVQVRFRARIVQVGAAGGIGSKWILWVDVEKRRVGIGFGYGVVVVGLVLGIVGDCDQDLLDGIVRLMPYQKQSQY